MIATSGSIQARAGRRERDWTDEQRRAIERREGDLLLDAGAGSGKTSVLVERFVAAVLQDGIEVAGILTITFTEKAAAELRDRIRLRLRELGAIEPARATEGAFISTIHGFCARILRAHALAAGLDPGFVVLDSDRSGPLASAAFDEALSELAGLQSATVDLIAAYGAPVLRAAVLGVYGQLRSGGELEPRLAPCPPDTGAGPGHELRRAAELLGSELGTIDAPSPNVVQALARAQRCLDLVGGGGAIAGGEAWPAELDRCQLPRNGSALTTDACVAYAEALGRFRAVCAERAARPVWDLLDRLLQAYGRHYAARKRAVSGVDFEDLELLARELLRADGELRERYANRFERIMVDEFQDTNLVQLELIEAIARGNLFTVGDAQQSIYAFRHADVALFERRRERLGSAGQRETLQTNFRSRAEILDAVNLAFAAEPAAGFRPLRPGRSAPRRGAGVEAEPRVDFVLVDKGADWDLEGLASPWRLAEASALADRVAQLVGQGTAPGEVVVLTRATTDVRAYERALERRGLPTYVIGGRGYWSHPQVVDLVAYLRALSNPRDEESLFTVLASPMVGASFDALVVLAGAARSRERDPWWLLRDPAGELDPLDEADRHRLAEFAGWFGAERERAARAGIESLIDRALELTGYDLEMLAMPGGQRRLANVRKLMRLGREYEDERGLDLRGFLDRVSDRQAGRAADAREGEAPVEGDGLNAVRLMTIHRAKGLEFHTVCVADLGRSPWRPNEILRVCADGRIGLRLIRAGVAGRASAFAYDELGSERQRAADAEERRLFYVAVTRAQERLVLSGATRFEGWNGESRSNGGGPVAWLAPAFIGELGEAIAAGGGVVVRDGVAVRLILSQPEGGEAPASSEVPAPGRSGLQPRVEPPAAPGRVQSLALEPPAAPPLVPVSTLSYSSLGEYARCGYRFYAERVLGLPPAPSPGRPQPHIHSGPSAGPDASERGVLVHALLERLDFRRPSLPDFEALAAVAARAGIVRPSTAEAQELLALVADFAAGELCARLGRALDTRREQRFAFPIAGAGGVHLTGAIDVLAREPGGQMLIVDYKSDRLHGADPAVVWRDSYATQRLIYALAALRAGAETVDVAHCFLERPSEPVLATFSAAQSAELEAELESLAGGVLRREFRVAADPHRALCGGCPAEGGLCSWSLTETRRESPDRLF